VRLRHGTLVEVMENATACRLLETSTMLLIRTTLAVAVLTLAGPALAQEPPSDPDEPDEPAEPDDAPKKGKKKPKQGTPDRLDFGGRVYVRDTLTGVDVAGDTIWLEDRTLDSARTFLSFRPNKRTRMDLEVDFAGDQAELKDTFIRYRLLPFLDVAAGRFKRPVSFLGLSSSWDLPRIDRGLLSELRIDTRRLLFAGGRGDGISLAVELPGALRPELTLTVQESDLAGDLGLEVTEVNQDAFARAAIEPLDGLHLAVAGGLVGTLRERGDPESYRHRPFGTLEGFFEHDRLRVWLEGMAGLNANTYVGVDQIGRFAAVQSLIAPRFEPGGPLRTIEPYAAFGWYEPSHRQAGDQLTEVTGGVALWISGKLRLQLEGGRRFAQGAAAPSADATIVRIQLGAAFKTRMELP